MGTSESKETTNNTADPEAVDPDPRNDNSMRNLYLNGDDKPSAVEVRFKDDVQVETTISTVVESSKEEPSTNQIVIRAENNQLLVMTVHDVKSLQEDPRLIKCSKCGRIGETVIKRQRMGCRCCWAICCVFVNAAAKIVTTLTTSESSDDLPCTVHTWRYIHKCSYEPCGQRVAIYEPSCCGCGSGVVVEPEEIPVKV